MCVCVLVLAYFYICCLCWFLYVFITDYHLMGHDGFYACWCVHDAPNGYIACVVLLELVLPILSQNLFLVISPLSKFHPLVN